MTIALYSVIDQGHMCVLLLINTMCVMSQLIPKEASWNFIRHTDMAHRTLKGS